MKKATRLAAPLLLALGVIMTATPANATEPPRFNTCSSPKLVLTGKTAFVGCGVYAPPTGMTRWSYSRLATSTRAF